MSKLILEQDKCICCGACQAVCPKYFEIQETDGKSKLIGSTVDKATKNEELEVESLDCIKEAAAACPIQIIRIEE